MKKIILASNSPRRKEILSKFNLHFDIITADIDENVNPSISAYELAANLAYKKAMSIASTIDYDAIIIGADTIVFHNKIYGKPVDKIDAYNMIKNLSGKMHEVITGLAVIDTSNNKKIKTYETTEVYFREIEEDEINRYIDTGEAFDKAGGYAIQGIASLFIKKIHGDYHNVVGLPIYKLNEILKNEFNINLI